MDGGCLICGGPKLPIKWVPSFPLPPGENILIREHLWAIFILRRFLQLPKDRCDNLLLRTFGRNPGGWFTLCETCAEVSHSAFRISAQILGLERELEGLREEAKGRLRRSLEEEEEKQHKGICRRRRDVFCVREEVREYFQGTFQSSFPPCGEVEVTRVANDENVKVEPADDEEGIMCVSAEEVEELSDYHQPSPCAELEGNNDKEEEKEEMASEPPPKKTRGGHKRPSGTSRTSLFRPEGPKRKYNCRKPLKVGTDTKRYKCDKCDFATQYGFSYKKHLKHHKVKDHIVRSGDSPKKSFRCNICNDEFPFRNEAVQHLRVRHGAQLGIKTFPCATCGQTFEDKNLLALHIKVVHLKIKQFCCDVCGAGYAKIADFEDHRAKHSNKAAFVCDICGAQLSTRRSLQEHRTHFHPLGPAGAEVEEEDQSSLSSLSVNKCPHCDLNVANNQPLRVHLKAAHGDLYRFACDLCDATYTRSGGLAIHKAAAHGTSVKCQYCDKMVKCSKYLANHWAKFCRKYPERKNS